MNDKTTQIEPELPELPEPFDRLVGHYAEGAEVFTADQMRAYALSAIAADRNKREGEPAATAVPYGWINAGTDRQQTEYATLHVGPENPWKETANAFPVYAAPVSAGLSDDAIAKSKRILALVDDYHEKPTTDTRTALRVALMDEFEAARMLPEGWVSVKDRLPDGARTALVLTYTEGGSVGTHHVATVYDLMREELAGVDRCYITHWMPLPAAPLPNGEIERKTEGE